VTVLYDSHDKPVTDLQQLLAAPEGKILIDPGEDFRDEVWSLSNSHVRLFRLNLWFKWWQKTLEKERLERLERQKQLETKKEKDPRPQRSVSQKLTNSKERKRSSSSSTFGDNLRKFFRRSDKEKTKKKAPGWPSPP